MSTNKKREGINRFACDVSLYDAEKPKASIKYHKPPLPIILFGIVAYGFVRQPFSKQLYSNSLATFHCVLEGDLIFKLNPGPTHNQSNLAIRTHCSSTRRASQSTRTRIHSILS